MEKQAKAEFKKFLDLWKLGEHDNMLALCQKTWVSTHPNADLGKLFPVNIQRYSMGEVKGVTPAHFAVKATVEINGEKKELVGHVIKESEPFKPSLEGVWGVNPTSVLKNLNF